LNTLIQNSHPRTKMQSIHQSVLQCLPDTPRWIEARSMLLNGRGLVLDFQADPEASGAPYKGVLFQEDIGLGVLIGKPDADLLFQISELADEIICPIENAEHCTSAFEGWSKEGATIYLRNKDIPMPELETSYQRTIKVGELAEISDLPQLLFEELEEEQNSGTEIYCATTENKPIAFCYAGSISEKYWDISIDTLPAYRRQGHATRSVVYAINQMEKQNREPVWAAVDSNRASLAMADKLGFMPVDRLMVFTRIPD